MGAELGDDWSRKFEDCWPLGSNHEPLLWDLSAYADQPTISATRKAVVIMVPFSLGHAPHLGCRWLWFLRMAPCLVRFWAVAVRHRG